MENRLIGGRYEIIGKLGEGGIASVYSAKDIFFNEIVALKIAHQGQIDATEALINEYKFSTLYNHPALVQAKSLLFESDYPIIVMPLINGITLDEILNTQNGDLSEEMADGLLTSILECSAFLHYSNILYNDFKPSNFILQDIRDQFSGGNIRLIDYNLISCVDEKIQRRGTLEYTAPEVIKGDNPSSRSDLYSIGVLFYEILTGELPFESGSESQLIREITESRFREYEKLPPRFKAGIESMLSPDPDRRPENALSAAELLGLGDSFRELVSSRIKFYLLSGLPSFSEDLDFCISDYFRGESNIPFAIKGLTFNDGYLSYIRSKLELNRRKVWQFSCVNDRLKIDDFLNKIENKELDILKSDVLIFSDFEKIPNDQKRKLSLFLSNHKIENLVIDYHRWNEIDFKKAVFDPMPNRSAQVLTEEYLKSYLKIGSIDGDLQLIIQQSKGDPELLYHFVLSSINKSNMDSWLCKTHSFDNIDFSKISGYEHAMEKLFHLMEGDECELFEKLSACGGDIPILLLSRLNNKEHVHLNNLIRKGLICRNKREIQLSSGWAADYFYKRLNANKRREYHTFWADACGLLEENENEYVDFRAYHWGHSGNPEKGYIANFEAANYYLELNQLDKAENYASRLLEMDMPEINKRLSSLIINAEIMKKTGDYKNARKHILRYMRLLPYGYNPDIRAKLYKDLGDIYRSMRMPGKSITYSKRALLLFENRNDKQGIADCYNNIGLAYWVLEKFEDSLKMFFSSLKLNEALKNYGEMAKIESNIGIIYDITGKTGDVMAHFGFALENSRKSNDRRLEALILNNIGYFYLRQSEYENAKTNILLAFNLSEEIGFTEQIINAAANLGICYFKQGELIKSAEYSQKAREMADSFGNENLKIDAEIDISEVCVYLCNFALADEILSGLENNPKYNNDKNLRIKINMKRAFYFYAIAEYDKGIRIIEDVKSYAETIGDRRLAIESNYLDYLLNLELGHNLDTECIADQISGAERLGIGDIAEKMSVLIARQQIKNNDLPNATRWIEKAGSYDIPFKGDILEIEELKALIMAGQKEYDLSLDILQRVEMEAASNGYLNTALNAVISSASIYIECQKEIDVKDCLNRAEFYLDKMIGSLSLSSDPDIFKTKRAIKRYYEISDIYIENDKIISKY